MQVALNSILTVLAARLDLPHSVVSCTQSNDWGLGVQYLMLLSLWTWTIVLLSSLSISSLSLSHENMRKELKEKYSVVTTLNAMRQDSL